MSNRRPAAVAAAMALALSACAGTSAETPRVRGGARTGDELMRAGDYDGAAREYDREIAAGDGSADVREASATAKHRAAAAHASAAAAAADAGDLDRARAELARADSYGPDVLAVRDAHALIDPRIAAADRASQLRRQAKALVSTRPDEADRLLAEADAAAPRTDADTNLRREAALRAQAERSADAAAESWARRERARTAVGLAGAQFAGRPVARAVTLRRAIEKDLVAETSARDEAALRSAVDFANEARLDAAVVRVLRNLLVDRLVAAARDLLETSRPATAALLEIEARRLRGDVKTPALDAVRERATLTIVVSPFVDESGGRVDGAMLGRALRERLALDAAGGGLPIRAVDAPAVESSADAAPAKSETLRLTGRVLTARTSDGRVGRENRKVAFQVGTTRKGNPEYDDLAAKLVAASADVAAAEDERRIALLELEDARAQGLVPAKGSTKPGETRTTTRQALAQARLDAADAALKGAKDSETALRSLMQATPREVDEPVLDERNVVVTIKVKTAQLTAHVELSVGDEILLAQDITAAADHKETVSDGFAPAGLAPDPDDTPDDAAMAAKAADRFAAVAAGRIRAAAEKATVRRLDAARAARGAGRRDEAAESYALYLLGTPDVVSPERDEAARALAELLGVHVALRAGPKKDQP